MDFSKAPTRVNASKFAVAAWHVVDRLWHDRGKPPKDKFIANLKATCPELGLIRDWAETDKHRELDRSCAGNRWGGDWDGHVLATDKRVQGAGLSSYENDGAVSSKSLRASTRARSQSITSWSGYLSAMRP